MLDELVEDYAAFFRLDVTNGFQPVQEVIDNMLTRLEELTSVLQMIKLKNNDCSSAVSDDIIRKYRSEIIILSKKVNTINDVIQKLHGNVELLDKLVEKAEIDFGINNDNKLKNFLKPLLKRSTSVPVSNTILPPVKVNFQSVLCNFEDNSMSN